MPALHHSKPPESLLRELNEVATDAAGLADELRRAQNLPADFPAAELLEVMVQLQALPNGTAEGCRQPLEYARARLPAIRRRFIKTEAWGHHASCTNKMGPASDRMAVVDSQFRVHGVEGLRVVDTSVFPRIPGLFIAVPTYMISEKASDLILAHAAATPARTLTHS